MSKLLVEYAVIGGTGLSDSELLENTCDEIVETKYGSVKVKVGEYKGKKVCFLPRHGEGHSTPPHLINYRANILALKNIGVKYIIATAAVGSINEDMEPNDFIICDQFLDFTKSRVSTFYEGGEDGVLHIDMTDPYCPSLRGFLRLAGREVQRSKGGVSFHLHSKGTYVCAEGPRFETPAEIKMYGIMGGDLVGMTSVPECVLAREANMCYANISYITNYAAGISKNNLTHQEVLDAAAENFDNLQKIIFRTLDLIDCDDCGCQHANDEAGSLS